MNSWMNTIGQYFGAPVVNVSAATELAESYDNALDEIHHLEGCYKMLAEFYADVVEDRDDLLTKYESAVAWNVTLSGVLTLIFMVYLLQKSV